jgi:hypothetical protein
MTSTLIEARSLMDEFLPDQHFRADHDARIDAPCYVVYQCLLRSNFNQLWLVRFLMRIRNGKRARRNPGLGKDWAESKIA